MDGVAWSRALSFVPLSLSACRDDVRPFPGRTALEDIGRGDGHHARKMWRSDRGRHEGNLDGTSPHLAGLDGVGSQTQYCPLRLLPRPQPARGAVVLWYSTVLRSLPRN